MNIASSSSAVVAASSNPNDAKIEKLETKRETVEAKRELVEKVLEEDEVNRPDFCANTRGCKGYKYYNVNELKEEKIRLDQQESPLGLGLGLVRVRPDFEICVFAFFLLCLH